MIRQDITEGKEGVPLDLRIVVDDPTTCAPLANAAVEIWHYDALGYYSGVEANNPGGGVDGAAVEEAAAGAFLRGVQLSAADGVVQFRTIFPGWYAGRTVHIHTMVHTDGAPEDDTYEGGQVNHIGQLFFDEVLTAELFTTVEPYTGRDDAERLRNEEDNILGDHDDEPGVIVPLTPIAAAPRLLPALKAPLTWP
jgi:protocatechuate 3,4-dioxygenase beta subunit